MPDELIPGKKKTPTYMKSPAKHDSARITALFGKHPHEGEPAPAPAAYAPFKMKGFSGFGNSPTKHGQGTMWDHPHEKDGSHPKKGVGSKEGSGRGVGKFASPAKVDESFSGIKDSEKRKKLTELYKQAEEKKGDPEFWKTVKQTLGTTGGVSYQGTTY